MKTHALLIHSAVTNGGSGYGFPAQEQPFKFPRHQPNDGSSYFLSHEKRSEHIVVRVILQGSMLLACAQCQTHSPLASLAKILSASALSTGSPAHREATVVHSVVPVVQDVDHPTTS